jgi:hypothetical protein
VTPVWPARHQRGGARRREQVGAIDLSLEGPDPVGTTQGGRGSAGGEGIGAN